jgi:L-fucose isomerase-like protein
MSMSSTIEVPMASRKGSSKSQTPVGVLILGRKRPGFDQEWNKIICKRSVAALESLGYTCVGQDAPMVDDATLGAALDSIRAAGCDSIVMLQPSMGNGQLALSLSQAWAGPIVLWATPERPGDGKVSSCSLVGQHLWGSMLRQANHPFELVYGDPDDAATRKSLVRAIALSRTAAKLRSAKIGVIGTYAPGFIDLAADPFLLRRALGLQLHALSLPQFIDRVNKLDEAAVRADIEQVHKLGLPFKDVTEADLAMNSRVYLAMRDLIQEESLSGLCIQCWPELPEMIGQWPYLAISRLTAEGYAVAMEGDVDGAIAEVIGTSLGLGNAFLTDWLEHDDKTVFLWHPGMAPLDMCYAAGETNGPCLAKHFNITKPLVVDGALRTGQSVTITRLWRCDGEYRMTAFEGKSIPSTRNLTGNTVLVEAEGAGLMKRFDTLVHEGMPHHVLLYNSHCAETLRRLARITGIHWID